MRGWVPRAGRRRALLEMEDGQHAPDECLGNTGYGAGYIELIRAVAKDWGIWNIGNPPIKPIKPLVCARI